MWTGAPWAPGKRALAVTALDRKSTRLNSKSRLHLVCRLLLEKKKKKKKHRVSGKIVNIKKLTQRYPMRCMTRNNERVCSAYHTDCVRAAMTAEPIAGVSWS